MIKNRARAFTLIEVLIAMVILAGAMVVLLSLESAAVARSINDRLHFHASLAARSIMSSIELQEKLEDQETIKPLLELLEDYNAQAEINDYTRALYDRMEAALIVQEMDLSGLLGAPPAGGEQQPKPLTLKKLSLGIRWGMGEEQNINIYYARAQDEKQ